MLHEGYKIRCILDDPSDMVAIIYRHDEVIGRIRMDWSNFPFQYDYHNPKLFKVFDLLAEYGHLRMENEKNIEEVKSY